jgi:Protein kinase domain
MLDPVLTPPWKLTFADAELERRYRSVRLIGWPRFATGTAIMFACWVGFLGWAFVAAPQQRAEVPRMIIGVIVPLFGTVLVVTRIAPALVRRQWIAIVGPLSALPQGLIFVALELRAQPPLDRDWRAYFAVCLLTIHTFINARFPIKQALTWSLVAAWWGARGLTHVDDLNWIGLAQTLGSYLAYSAERQSRRIFLQRLTIEEQRAREVEILDREVRRQVAERSRELTESLARSEGSVTPAALEVGDVFDGRYRVTRALGRGGMGAVYEVDSVRDGRKLALKVVTATMQAKQAARFAREAEIGARLQHENLVSILDVGITAGATPFLVMELVEGGSMEEQRARFGDVGWALPILAQIASGLTELHAHRIVHRDLKPGNVLLVGGSGGATTLAKISDFGLSRFGAPDDSADVVQNATQGDAALDRSPRDLTETGALMGTPVYMPPEAWFGPARHPSADLFSLGVLAYEALTGRSPFPVPPVLLVRARQPIPTPAPLDGLDDRVASLVLACLCVEPSERPRAKDLAIAIGGALAGR